MTLLAPGALLGLLLLALPVIVHLLRPRKMQPTPFSSLRWLKITRQRLSRRIQWHQWLLFLMRAGLIVLLVLALAKPIMGLWETHRPTDRFIIVDAGRVMNYQAKDGSPFERARTIAARLVAETRAGDRTAVVLADRPLRTIAPLTSDAAAHLGRLRAVSAESTDDPVTSALALVPGLLGPHPERDVELIFVTANQRASWRQADVREIASELVEKLRVQIVDVGPGAAANAWIAGARLIERGDGEDMVLRVLLGFTGPSSETRMLRLSGIDGIGDEVREASLIPGQRTHVDFSLPATLSFAGQSAHLRLEPEDALASDDAYCLNLDMAWALRLLFVEPARDAAEVPGPTLHLRTALDALASAGNHSFRLSNRSAASVTPADAQNADIIILAGVPRLADDVLAGLEQRVRAGAGVIVYLGPEIDTAFYRQQLFRPAQPQDGLAPLALRADPDAFKPGGPDRLQQIQWTHPILVPLRDPQFGDLASSEFRRFAVFDGKPGAGDQLLARFADGTPALVDRTLGAGHVLFWNTTADDLWTDLPRRSTYTPLVDQMVAYLSAGGVRRQFVVGQPINLPLVGVPAGKEVRVVGPDGGELPARIQSVGCQTILHLDRVNRPGLYKVESADSAKAWTFAVNTSREASPLAPMDAETLRSWWSPAACEVIDADAALAQLEAHASGWTLWPALILLGGVLLLAETVYVYRLCPRKNPAVVSSVVPERGILVPLSRDR
jgi:hypothetical protein